MTNENNANLPDLRPREWAIIVPIIAVAILMGVFPNLFLRPIEPSVERMLNQVQSRASAVLNAQRDRSPSPPTTQPATLTLRPQP